jgi:hypothetical protein
LECAFDVVEKILMRGFNGINLVRFGFRMWQIFLKWFLPLKIQKFQKTRFWKEKSVEDVVTLGPHLWI